MSYFCHSKVTLDAETVGEVRTCFVHVVLEFINTRATRMLSSLKEAVGFAVLEAACCLDRAVI